MSSQVTLTALLYGPDKKGLVSKTSGWIFACDGNIIHADQHTDKLEGIFFQRIVWVPSEEANVDSHVQSFESFVRELGMNVSVRRSDERLKIGVLVSKIPHCFNDLLLRWKSGELDCDVPLVISNHEEMRGASEYYGVPYHCLPVNKENKLSVEAEQIRLFKEAGVDLVVMARYMQVLSDDFLDRLGCPVINIHHSFLPAFAGAKPYHQAYERGVKLIGATAHYATADLDEGPIIQQAVAPVSHRHGIRDLIQKGRDLEKSVFAQAARWHLESRILTYNNKTVVFD